MSLKVEQKFVVGKKIFDTAEEAEKYLVEFQDQSRIDAYTDFLRENGTQRISRTITDHLMDFIKFEKGELVVSEEKKTTETEEPEEPEVQEVLEKEITSEDKPSKSVFADSDNKAESADFSGSDESPTGAEDDSAINKDDIVPAALTEKPKTKGKSLFA